jgi:type VI secretion system protein ImpL
MEGMSNRKLSGYWIVIGAMTLAVAIAVWFKGASIHPSPVFRVMAVLLIGAILLLLRSAVVAAWHFVARFSPTREPDRYKRDQSARAGIVDETDTNVIAQRFANLRLARQDANGFRWRYRQPWLLLTGSDSSIG